MKKAIIILLLIPTLSFSQDSLDVEKRRWDNLTEGFCVLGISYTIPTAALIVYTTKPYPEKDLRNIAIISSGLFIGGVIWISSAASKLTRKKKRIK